MSELLSEVESYWSGRADGYSQSNERELNGTQKQAWQNVLLENIPSKGTLDVLDVGCGPGFFTILSANAGHNVTAIDYTEEMIKRAKSNLERYAVETARARVRFIRMDAQELSFDDESFDVVVSRNITWNLENPAKAYSEWTRVLKKGGILLNFDANWYNHLFDQDKRAAYEEDRRKAAELNIDDHYTSTDISRMEKIAYDMPLSSIMRPEWDKVVLEGLNVGEVIIDNLVWEKVWDFEEQVNYASTPMFMVKVVKEC